MPLVKHKDCFTGVLLICTVSLSQGHVYAFDFQFLLRSFLCTDYMFVSYVFLFT